MCAGSVQMRLRDQGFVVVGQVHEGGEVLAQADRVDDGEPHLAGRQRREETQHQGLERLHRGRPARPERVQQQAAEAREGQKRRQHDRLRPAGERASQRGSSPAKLPHVDGQRAEREFRPRLERRPVRGAVCGARVFRRQFAVCPLAKFREQTQQPRDPYLPAFAHLPRLRAAILVELAHPLGVGGFPVAAFLFLPGETRGPRFVVALAHRLHGLAACWRRTG